MEILNDYIKEELKTGRRRYLESIRNNDTCPICYGGISTELLKILVPCSCRTEDRGPLRWVERAAKIIRAGQFYDEVEYIPFGFPEKRDLYKEISKEEEERMSRFKTRHYMRHDYRKGRG